MISRIESINALIEWLIIAKYCEWNLGIRRMWWLIPHPMFSFNLQMIECFEEANEEPQHNIRLTQFRWTTWMLNYINNTPFITTDQIIYQIMLCFISPLNVPNKSDLWIFLSPHVLTTSFNHRSLYWSLEYLLQNMFVFGVI